MCKVNCKNNNEILLINYSLEILIPYQLRMTLSSLSMLLEIYLSFTLFLYKSVFEYNLIIHNKKITNKV